MLPGGGLTSRNYGGRAHLRSVLQMAHGVAAAWGGNPNGGNRGLRGVRGWGKRWPPILAIRVIRGQPEIRTETTADYAEVADGGNGSRKEARKAQEHGQQALRRTSLNAECRVPNGGVSLRIRSRRTAVSALAHTRTRSSRAMGRPSLCLFAAMVSLTRDKMTGRMKVND